jgi:hypothetical protein
LHKLFWGVAASVLTGCTSPSDFLQQSNTALSNLSSAFQNYEDFKSQIKMDAYYARVSYADSSRTGYFQKAYSTQITGDTCLKYAPQSDTKYKDVQARLKAITKILDSAKTTLCTAAAETGQATTGLSCPTNTHQSTASAANAFFSAVKDAVALTAMTTYVPIASSAASAALAVYNFTTEQAAYQAVISYLSNPGTQKQLKFAITQLESDLSGFNDDLDNNMRIWTACQTARLQLAALHLNWNDGSSQVTFSGDATQYQKDLDAAQLKYNSYKSFASTTTKSLNDLQTIFAKVPTLQADPSALQPILDAIDSINTNLTSLNSGQASNTKSSTTKKTAGIYLTSPSVFVLAHRPMPKVASHHPPVTATNESTTQKAVKSAN